MSHALAPRVPRALQRSIPVVLSLLLTGLGACGPSVRWHFDPRSADAQVRRAPALRMVYFRNWYSVECTRFEDDVLRDADVVAALRDVVCVMLSYDFDRPLADEWGVTSAPGAAVVDTGGRSVSAITGAVTRDEFLRWLDSALRIGRAAMEPPDQTPVAPPPPPDRVP
ncbi:MAG: hypothetical protein IPM64_13955 [Phycisphaerales bacterium]|nr:hypothetical protein [Phycisphaerales bacterium]